MAALRICIATFCLFACVILQAEAASKVVESKNAHNSSAQLPHTSSTKSPSRSSTTKAQATPRPQHKTVQKHVTGESRQKASTPSSIPADDLDGRSAYVNNQYIPDEPMMDGDSSPPLYQFLQQQMEHILASTGSEVADYVEETAVPARKEASSAAAPSAYGLNLKPVQAYGLDTFKEYDEEGENGAYTKEQDKVFHNFAAKPTAAPELPRPISSSAAPELPRPIGSSSSTSNKVKPERAQPQSSYGSQPPASPILKPTQPAPTKHQQQAYLNRNSTIHMRKRRITFKTVSSASQIIATPLADLMFKFSIGIAKPSTPMSSSSSSSSSISSLDSINTEEPSSSATGYSGNLDLPKRSRPVVHPQKYAAGVKKTE